MSSKFKSLIIVLLIAIKSFSQCEIKSFKISDSLMRYSMSEVFYGNKDLENGIKRVFVHINAFKKEPLKIVLLNTIVVSYIYTDQQQSFTPGRLVIKLQDGNVITLLANNKSTNSLNEIPAKSNTINSIEGIFYFSSNDVSLLLSSNIYTVNIFDYRAGNSLDITPSYNSLLTEMINCVNR